MPKKRSALVVSFFAAVSLLAQNSSSDRHKAAEQPCQLISANPPNFHPFQFLPKKFDFTQINRLPRVSYDVHEDGNVTNVKVLRGTGSAKVDAALVKSIQAWKYKPQPGRKFEMSGEVIIDIGP